jgi:hypothetical protein
MCYCGESELPTMFRQTWHVARKEHKCCECRDTIKIGERYERSFGVWDGDAQEFKTCSSCVEVRSEVYEMAGYWPAFGSAGCCYAEALRDV